LREAHDRYCYSISGNFACEAFGCPEIGLEVELKLGGQTLSLRRPAVFREPFAGGYREPKVTVLPAISIRPQTLSMIVPHRAEDRQVDLQLALRRHLGKAGETARLKILPPEGWTVNPASLDLSTGARGETTAAHFRLTIPGGAGTGRYRLEYRLGPGSGQPAVMLEPVWMGSPGISRPPDATTCSREAFITAKAEVNVSVIEARFASDLRYGYVRGAAEGIVEALSHFGLSIHEISDEEMDYVDLTGFDAIVIGPNAYLIRDALRKNAASFLDYAAKGGSLIVQYQGYGFENRDFAPYPFAYSHPHDRVTYPDAPVKILEPEHPLMRHPNRITRDDFAGWVLDRGLYFFGKFDSRYIGILGCNDPGEELKRGGLVFCGYGRGAFVYVGYSLFHQIPAAVPGAFRLLANLLALPEALLLERAKKLQSLSFFSNMGQEQLLAVAKIVAERFESSGTYLCRQGEPGQELFIVAKGEVEIARRTGSDTVLRRAGAGEVIGEFAILVDVPRAADLRAVTNVDLLVISGAHFRALIRQYPEIADSVIRELVMKLVVS
jgi:hypothetical protein